MSARAVLPCVPALLCALLLTSCAPTLRAIRPPSEAERTAQAFLEAWADGDLGAQRALTDEGSGPLDEAMQAQWRERLGVVSSRFEILRVDGQDEGPARVCFRAVHGLRGLGEWALDASLELVRHHEGWRVRWTPAVLHPLARRGDRFERTRSFGPRAPLLDARGEALTVEGEVIAIGLVPGRVKQPSEVASALEAELGVDPSRVTSALQAHAARPDTFVPLIDVRADRYAQVRPSLAPVPGIFFRRKTARLTPSEGFASHTLGRVGEVTAERLAELGPPYQVGDVVGLSGLERAFERELAGTPSGEVRLRRAEGESLLLHAFEGHEGQPVRTTLRRDVQHAAEVALSDVQGPAALVAVDVDSGAVLAVVSRPHGVPLNRALQGRYPPGSTFKVVTAEALLASGLGPGSPVPCPPQATVGGFRFRNFEGLSLGQTTLRRAFAESCNTTFVMLADRLPEGALAEAAGRFGFGAAYEVGLPSPGASFPEPLDAADRAAASIGQGRVLATPVHMASVAAAAVTGTWRAPWLVEDDAFERSSRPRRLISGAAPALRDLMRAVVAEGTGKAAGAQDRSLVGKTGSAEFGTTPPFGTHAWFIGVQADIAFAILVEGGGTGGRVAAPIAARFVSALSP